MRDPAITAMPSEGVKTARFRKKHAKPHAIAIDQLLDTLLQSLAREVASSFMAERDEGE